MTRPLRRHPSRPRQGGFTLVELMVAIALSGVVIGFVFQIHNQMVGALRGQANLSEVVEEVTAAREMIARELRLAGMGFPSTGVQFGPTDGVDIWRGVDGINDVDGGGQDVVDQISMQRTDGDVESSVAGDLGTEWFFPIVGADTLGFNTTDPVMLLNLPGTTACAPTPTLVDPTGIKVDDAAFGTGACKNFMITNGDSVKLSRIRRIAFRLDPTASRYELGVLQRSINGAAWEDIGIGYTNLQVAVRFHEAADAVDADGDGDATKDWYSGDEMEPGGARPQTGIPMQVGISIEARNLRRLDNLASLSTPAYTIIGNEQNNPLGNFGQACVGAQYDPCGVPDLGGAGLPPRYQFPEHVYRSSSTTVWLRSRLESL